MPLTLLGNHNAPATIDRIGGGARILGGGRRQPRTARAGDMIREVIANDQIADLNGNVERELLSRAAALDMRAAQAPAPAFGQPYPAPAGAASPPPLPSTFGQFRDSIAANSIARQVNAQDASYLGFLQNQLTHIEAAAYRTQYPDIQYRRLVPVDTSAPEWVRTIAHYSTDIAGEVQEISNRASTMPVAEVEREQYEVLAASFGIGYDFDMQEIAQAMMLGMPLRAEKAAAARRKAEEHIDKVVLEGDATKNWDGFIDFASVPKSNAPNGASGHPDWARKTPDEILKDINSTISGVWTNSLTVEMADTIALPTAMLELINTTRVTDTSMTIRRYVDMNNSWTLQTGMQLDIEYCRGLEKAAAGNTARMIAYRNDPSVLKLHMPMPFRFLGLYESSWAITLIPGMFRLAGLEVRRPQAMRYLDGIAPAA